MEFLAKGGGVSCRGNKDKLAITRSAVLSFIILGPNQTKDIRGIIDRELNYHPTFAILQETLKFLNSWIKVCCQF